MKRAKRKRRPSKIITDELQYALLAVVAFLTVGLSLGYFLLHHQHRKVVLHVMKDPWAHGGALLHGRAGFRHHFYAGSPRYVTIVMPSVVNPKGRKRRLEAIQDTWGPYARAVYVVHNITEFPQAAHAVISEDSSPEDPYAFPQLLMLPVDMSESEGLPRLFYTIRTILDRVDPDFAFFVNDHTYVLPSHLCKFLEHYDPEEDLYAGHALHNSEMDVFNSGAAGAILSRSSLKKIVEHHNAHDPECYVEEGSKWLQGNPGLVVSNCLRSLDIHAIDTRDSERWHRFHAFPLTRMVAGSLDNWFYNKHKGMSNIPGFSESYEEILAGEDCCSKTTVSFHYVDHMEARALFSVREALLTNPNIPDHELKALMHAEWPKEFRDIGAYSRGLPKENDEEGWAQLLAVLRKISTRETQVDC